jgi:hypothetical protein
MHLAFNVDPHTRAPMTVSRHTVTLTAAICLSLWALPSEAEAEVRFGKNVRIGGHDVSNQTFNAKRRGLYYIYAGKPANPGCTWRRNADGSSTKVCHLQRKR